MRKVLLLAVGLLAIVGAGCDPTSPYAAKVNGTTITQADLNNELNAIRTQASSQVAGAGQNSFKSSIVAQVLDQQINYQLIHQQVVSRGIKISGQDLRVARASVASAIGGAVVLDAFPASYQNTLISRRAEQIALEAKVAGVDISAPAMAQYYSTHQQSFVTQCVSYALLASQADAAAVQAQIAAGANFADVASRVSLDRATRAKGGNLGCVPKGVFPTDFEQAVDALAIGQVSQPVQIPVQTQLGTQTGWAIILVTNRPPLSLEQAAPQIQAALLANAQGPLADAFRRTASSAHIIVNPRYGTYNAQGGLQAPLPPPESTLNFVPTTTTTTPSPFGP